MTNPGDVQYRMKCPVCGRPFIVDRVASRVPEHPQKGQALHPEIMYARCSGSGQGGILSGTVVKRDG